MRKNKSYIFLAVLTIIFLFGTAAICSQCSQNGEPPGTEPVETPPDGEPTEEEPPSAPTIKLSIQAGYPKYLEEGDICYYRIKADVTGSPTPDVVFSQDDSGGSWGDYIAQVNVASIDEVIVLTATAINTEGSDDASIELGWGCNGEENRDPEITEIVLSDESVYNNEEYDVSVEVTDPDEDDLEYKWTVEGGIIDDNSINPMKWRAPGVPGIYEIEVKVTDGNGGEDTDSISVMVNTYLLVSVPQVADEGGHVGDGVIDNSGGCLFAGDSNDDDGGFEELIRGFISFDISSLSDAKIREATLTFNHKNIFGDPSGFGDLSVIIADWGENTITPADFGIGGELIGEFSDPDFSISGNDLVEKLQDAVDAGKTRIQFVILFILMGTDGQDDWDGWEYDQSDVTLDISYVP